jgi:hypothetical protein
MVEKVMELMTIIRNSAGSAISNMKMPKLQHARIARKI